MAPSGDGTYQSIAVLPLLSTIAGSKTTREVDGPSGHFMTAAAQGMTKFGIEFKSPAYRERGEWQTTGIK
jgi:hypothetical protein